MNSFGINYPFWREIPVQPYCRVNKMVTAKKWVLVKQFVGKPKESDFSLEEETIPDEVNDGGVLCEALYLSVDPYIRFLSNVMMKPGDTLVGEQIARVIASKNPKYAVGEVIRLSSGWRSHTLVTDVTQIDTMPELGDLPLSFALGAAGVTGLTALFGLEDKLKPMEGETVLVNSAAGAVGSVVGQLAKMKGCTVIGFAGTDDKVRWLTELGFDHAFNYKKVDIDEALSMAAPSGVNCYFDNVGGCLSTQMLQHMHRNARVLIAGSIATYNDIGKSTGPYLFEDILKKCMSVTGFSIYDTYPKWRDGEAQLASWIQQGKLQHRETVTEGFEFMPQAFMGLFEGICTGKALVKA
ncbi:prostaglandin reductase 1-like [Mizuhopecten yessoensis]|uniref:Prostaglandin reductase 1 n=1 Tax=Mizuhopecten yessoensis TaxID=6573 RepID=A0A210PSP4_MIZYE|nr:prostaglandin reductase 1-like [Mizuhopecten yessoensis]OWF39513.1 Prostaglandin reductase 1 [Mizuhopecten yessoensis]